MSGRWPRLRPPWAKAHRGSPRSALPGAAAWGPVGAGLAGSLGGLPWPDPLSADRASERDPPASKTVQPRQLWSRIRPGHIRRLIRFDPDRAGPAPRPPPDRSARHCSRALGLRGIRGACRHGFEAVPVPKAGFAHLFPDSSVAAEFRSRFLSIARDGVDPRPGSAICITAAAAPPAANLSGGDVVAPRSSVPRTLSCPHQQNAPPLNG